jgi:5-oxoprolinase (ATP-hydrolysing) subunit A
MPTIDLNCDMGEGSGQDERIMPFISSVNIACGYHAGDEKTIWDTIELATRHGVAIGAHISFFDRENFGRSEVLMPADQLYDMLIQQLVILDEIIGSFDLKIHHVKPHGALYNMSAKDPDLALTIARAIKDYDSQMILFGLSNSHSIREGAKLGLRTCSEAFADRTYQEDGSLTPRSSAGALIEDTSKAIEQVLKIIDRGKVTTASGIEIPLLAETVCLHGDGKQAASFAKEIHDALKQHHIEINAV